MRRVPLLLAAVLLALAVYGSVRLVADMIRNDEWLWLAGFIVIMVGLGALDFVRARRSGEFG